MPLSQFGERQYELAANLELLAGSGHFFTPTTSMEGHLGIDAALTPGDARIWTALGIAPPPGVSPRATLLPQMPSGTPTAAVPSFFLSLFVQYKRSTYLERSNAGEWASHNSPYWRVDLTKHQHDLLLELERLVGDDGVVRYAAPKFWRHSEMWQLQPAGAVLDNSLLVAPGSVGRSHNRLTWSSRAKLVGHSEPSELVAETPEDVSAEIVRRASRTRRGPAETTHDTLRRLASAVAELTASSKKRERWEDEINSGIAQFRFPDRDDLIGPLADLAIIAEAAYAARASLLFVGLSDRSSHRKD